MKFETLNNKELKELTESKKKEFEQAFASNLSYDLLNELYKEFQKLQYELNSRVDANPECYGFPI